jgi:hypothetical protein
MKIRIKTELYDGAEGIAQGGWMNRIKVVEGSAEYLECVDSVECEKVREG